MRHCYTFFSAVALLAGELKQNLNVITIGDQNNISGVVRDETLLYFFRVVALFAGELKQKVEKYLKGDYN